MMRDIDLLRGLAKKQTFLIIQKISGVPWLAVLALWGAFNGFRMSAKEAGFYGILPGSIGRAGIEKRLLDFAKLTLEEISDLAEKGEANFICASLMVASDLKQSSKALLYPDAPDEVIEKALKARHPDAVEIYRKLKDLE